MAYSQELVDAILSKTDIVNVVKAYIPVTKKGRNYMATCPFHDDKHPSLSVSPERQIFKCFVCGTSGNAISFVSKYEKISFDDAVRKVAEIIGFSDERLEKEAYVPKKDPTIEPLYKCIDDLQKLYQYSLNVSEGKEAKDYLSQRNIDEKLIEKYKIGYALNDGKKTIDYLRGHGHSLKSIQDIGIALASVNSKDGNAGRVIFPLCNPNGQVVGFSARKLKKEQDPKYINSPETPIFHKGKILYNYHNAKGTARHDGYVYVLEGFMDVMALDKAGIQSAVALMGTALSSDQIKLLRKLNCEVRLCLDGDNAGQMGMMKMITQLNDSGLQFRLVSNPNDLRDPDDILQESGADELRKAMFNLVDPMDFQINYYLNVKKLDTPEEREKVALYFIRYLRKMPPGVVREDCIVKLSKATGYQADAIRHRVDSIREDEEQRKEESLAIDQVSSETLYPEKITIKRLMNAERECLYFMLKEMGAIRYFKEDVQHFYDPIYNSIANYVVDYIDDRQEIISLPLLINDIERAEDEEADSIINRLTNIYSAEFYPPYSKKEMENCVKAIGEEKEKNYIKENVAKTIQTADTEEAKRVLVEYVKYLNSINIEKNKKH